MALKTIRIIGTGIRKEGPAIAAVTPGDLVEEVATGIQRHGTIEEKTLPAFALEYELEGREIGVDYAINEQVLYEVFPPGARVLGFLEASSAAVVIGDRLVSAGDGSLVKYVEEAELADNTTGTGTDAVADGTATYSQTITNDNIASIVAKVNALLPGAAGVLCRAAEAVSPTASKTRCKMDVM